MGPKSLMVSSVSQSSSTEGAQFLCLSPFKVSLVYFEFSVNWFRKISCTTPTSCCSLPQLMVWSVSRLCA
jgi:hypothetical protein